MKNIDREIIEKINSDNSVENESVEELRTQFEKECAKKNPDYGLVDELAKLIAEQEGTSDKINIPDEIAELKRKTTISHKRIVSPKWLTAVCASLVLVLGLNAYSAYAWNMNIFSAIVKFTKGGFSVDFNEEQQDIVELPTSEDDPYGFLAKLAEYDIEFETPHYIPEGFDLTEIEAYNNGDVGQTVRFIFENGKMVVCLTYTKYYDEIPEIGIPSDSYNISEIEVNGSPAIVSKEDDQYTIVYQKNKTEFFMFADNVPYEECEKIVDSIR